MEMPLLCKRLEHKKNHGFPIMFLLLIIMELKALLKPQMKNFIENNGKQMVLVYKSWSSVTHSCMPFPRATGGM